MFLENASCGIFVELSNIFFVAMTFLVTDNFSVFFSAVLRQQRFTVLQNSAKLWPEFKVASICMLHADLEICIGELLRNIWLSNGPNNVISRNLGCDTACDITVKPKLEQQNKPWIRSRRQLHQTPSTLLYVLITRASWNTCASYS